MAKLLLGKEVTAALNAPDYEKAGEYYKMAADKGQPEAMFNLGLLYHYGRYGKKENALNTVIRMTGFLSMLSS